MARIKLDLPKLYHFRCSIPVRISDINYGGHLGNDAVLSIVHEARMQFLNHFGYSEMDIEGVGIIMADVAIVYKSEGFYGDILKVEVAVNDLSSVGFDLLYKLSNRKTGKEVARAKTGIVCFDYEKRKVSNVPEGFKDKF